MTGMQLVQRPDLGGRGEGRGHTGATGGSRGYLVEHSTMQQQGVAGSSSRVSKNERGTASRSNQGQGARTRSKGKLGKPPKVPKAEDVSPVPRSP